MASDPLKRDTGVINRKFDYVKGKVHLDFTLRIDIKQELKDFMEILCAAVEDVQKELDKK